MLERLKRDATHYLPGTATISSGRSPTLVAEIEYRVWTHDGKLRHAFYESLREVQDNAAVL
jgi:ATP-dependent DNA ligase